MLGIECVESDVFSVVPGQNESSNLWEADKLDNTSEKSKKHEGHESKDYQKVTAKKIRRDFLLQLERYEHTFAHWKEFLFEDMKEGLQFAIMRTGDGE